jgi:hypothetical protein
MNESVRKPVSCEAEAGRDAQLALLMVARWRDEIERAIDRVKKSVNRPELDRWFRRQWYRCYAVRLKREHEADNHRAGRRQIGEHGGDENGERTRGCRQYFVDLRLRQFRSVENPHEYVDFNCETGRRMREESGIVVCRECQMAAMISAGIDRKELRCMNCLALIVPRVRL